MAVNEYTKHLVYGPPATMQDLPFMQRRIVYLTCNARY